MLQVEVTTQFKRDLKLAQKRRKNLESLRAIMKQIEDEQVLEAKFRNHALTGNWSLHHELHIEPDWLLIYRLIHKSNTVVFVRTGTHSDLFR